MRDNGACAVGLALLVALGGCDRASSSPVPAASSSSTHEEPPKAVPLVDLVAPPAIHAFGGLTAAAWRGLVEDEQLIAALGRRIGVDPMALDPSRPGYFAVAARDVGHDDTVLLLPVTDALNNSVDGEPLGPNRWIRRGGAVHLGRVGGWVLASPRAALLDDFEPFWAQLAGASLSADGEAVISVEHAVAAHGEATASAVHGAARLGQRLGLEQITLQLGRGAKGWHLDLVAPQRGFSGLSALPQAARSLLTEVPADAVAVVLAQAAGEPARTLAQWLLQLTQIPKSGLADAEKSFVEAGDGQFAFFAVPAGSGLQLAAAAGVEDSQQMRAAQRKLQAGLQSRPAAAVHADLGLLVRFRRDAYQLDDQPVDVVETLLSPGKHHRHDLHRAFGDRASIFADLMTSHVQITDVARIAYGASGTSFLERWRAGLETTFATTQAAKQLWSENTPFLVGAFDLARLLSFLERPSRPADGGAFVRLAATTQNGDIHVSVDVPQAQVEDLRARMKSDPGKAGASASTRGVSAQVASEPE